MGYPQATAANLGSRQTGLIGVIAGAAAGGLALLFVILVYCIWRRRRIARMGRPTAYNPVLVRPAPLVDRLKAKLAAPPLPASDDGPLQEEIGRLRGALAELQGEMRELRMEEAETLPSYRSPSSAA